MGSETSKEILLAVDGSETSWNTAKIAVRLAQVLSADILGLHVIDEELVLNDYAEYQKELGIHEGTLSRTEKAELFENRGHDILQRLKSLCQESGVRVSIEIGLGGVSETIQEQARKEYILALGRRGNGHPDSQDYLGKNFRFIAHWAARPLLVGGDSAKPLKRVLLAYNGAKRAKKALEWVQSLQYQKLVETIALIVQEDDGLSIRSFEKDVKAEFSKSDIEKFRLIVRRGIPSDEISATAMECKSDIVLMGGYRHSAVLEWLEGSTLDSVLKKMPLPVLVV